MVAQNTLTDKCSDYLPVRSVSILYFITKRVFDFVLASIGLILLTPLFAIIALLVKLDSPGPAFFIQERVGAKPRFHNGRVFWETRNFTVYKFRSMLQNADPTVHQSYIEAYVHGDKDASANPEKVFKLTNDARITRVGHILRKTSLDELPQLINVLQGTMSLVGPRPLPVYEVALYEEWQRERLACLPGMTGLWQVMGRCRVGFDDQIQMDIEYVRTQSLLLDFKILVLTLPAVISGQGAG